MNFCATILCRDRAASRTRVHGALYRWLALAVWRQQPGAMIAAILAVAMGVALGLGIDLVNRSALSEFDDALGLINGEAQFRLSAADGRIDDTLLVALERDPAVLAASPVVAAQVPLSLTADAQADARLRVIGIDSLRTGAVAPALLPRVAVSAADDVAVGSTLFADDSIFLSPAALQRFDLAIGDALTLLINGRPVTLKIRGDVPQAGSDSPLAVMDIAAAQWRLGWLGQLSYIDVRLADGARPGTLLERLAAPRGSPAVKSEVLQIERPDAATARMSNLSRAYRINLNVLALVALLTGGFIVFASLELAVVRMLPMLALVGVLGAPPALRPTLILRLAVLLGVCGAALGTAFGIGLAWLLLGVVGGDLGGGYFSATRPPLVIPAATLLGFGLLGVLAALAGALSPALQLRRLAPAQALRNGQGSALPGNSPAGVIGAVLALAGVVLLALPPLDGLPVPAYLAVAAWLFAGVLCVSPLLGRVAGVLSARADTGGTLRWLAVNRLRSAHQSAFPALAGVVASFALVCAMAIMVHSFRESVDRWLDAVLPADLYVRVTTTGQEAALSAADRRRLRALDGSSRVSFLRSIDLVIDPERAPLEVTARPVDAADPSAVLPFTGPWLDRRDRNPSCVAVYVSEPASRLYDWSVGDRIALPLSMRVTPPPCFEVSGVFRDYARQQGAVTIDLADYRRLTGDSSVSNAAIWLDGTLAAEEVMARARAALAHLPATEIRSAARIRALSLDIFDRSFAVTYALEAVALLVGLFGVATTYSGEALSRRREFGMLRHLGITRAGLARLFAAESLLAVTLGVAWGTALGAAISQILIHRVNPQSFNWTMQTHWPIAQLVLAALALITLGVATAVIAARHAAGHAPIAAVRADW